MESLEAKVQSSEEIYFLYQVLLMSLVKRYKPDEFRQLQELSLTDPPRARILQKAYGLSMFSELGLTQKEVSAEIDRIMQLPPEQRTDAVLNFKKNPPQTS